MGEDDDTLGTTIFEGVGVDDGDIRQEGSEDSKVRDLTVTDLNVGRNRGRHTDTPSMNGFGVKKMTFTLISITDGLPKITHTVNLLR